MIRPIDIKLNAAHPELPLVEATTFTGAPSSVFIRGVPKAVGNWSITAVSVAVTYPDNTTTARAAVESAEGVWVATIPGTATSGRTAAGFKIMADGIDENGDAVTGYVLGFADFSVLSFTPVPAPGGTFYLLRYFDQAPATPKEGDAAKIDGVLKFYNGSAWEPFAAPVPLDNAVTPTSGNGVKSSGIWAAIWGALSALPTGFSSLYDWCVSQLAPKLARTELFPAWAANTAYTTYSLVIHENAVYKCTTAHTSGAEWDSTKWGVATGADVLGVLLNYLALSNKPQINNITLTGESSQSGDSLGLVDKTGDQTISGNKTFTGYGIFYDFTVSHPQGQGYVRIYASANENRVHIEFSDAVSGSLGELFLPVLGGYSAVTLAAIENLAPDAFPMLYDGATVDLNTLYCYQGRLYRCILGYTFQSGDSYPPDDTTHWALATVEDVLAALRTAIAGKANASDLPYAISESIPLTVTGGAASTTLDDRTHNVRTVAAPGSGNTTTITATLPAIVQGRSRDMFLNLTVGSAASDKGDISLSIVEPSGATVQIDIGSVEDIGVGENEIMIFERALPTTSGNTTTTHWQVTVRHEDFT